MKNGDSGIVYLGQTGDFDCPYAAICNMFAVVPANQDDPAFALGKGLPLYRDIFLRTIRTPLTDAGLHHGILGPLLQDWRGDAVGRGWLS